MSMTEGDSIAARQADALMAAAMLAVDPVGLGGIRLRARVGGPRDQWLGWLQALMPDGAAWPRLPAHMPMDRLCGGLDLAATLAQGRPVMEPGLLQRADGRIILLPMAERLPPALAASLAAVMDDHAVSTRYGGRDVVTPTTFGVVAFDEGIDDDEQVPEALADRLALHLDLDAGLASPLPDSRAERERISEARAQLIQILADDATCDAIAAVASALDVRSLRAFGLCLIAARVAAALDGAAAPTTEHISLAVRLVLVPRARQFPAPAETETPPPPSEQPPETESAIDQQPQALEEVVLEAALAALPPDVLARLTSRSRARQAASGARSSDQEKRAKHGRPAGIRIGDPRRGDRLDIIATLRTAAPWQGLRRRKPGSALVLSRSDFRVKRLVRPMGVTTIFVVDASGSAALHRLAEAKGAVELLLADCYVRRNHVALIAFRGKAAELLLPPTRALARAKRSLSALPGGGGTPIASALVMAEAVAVGIQRRGNRADIVLLTDGRANIDRQGRPGRAAADADAQLAAAALRAKGIPCIVIDTSARPDPASARLAEHLGATYLPLPYADARTLSSAIKLAQPAGARG
jgi:magnesium chelatase subunit D